MSGKSIDAAFYHHGMERYMLVTGEKAIPYLSTNTISQHPDGLPILLNDIFDALDYKVDSMFTIPFTSYDSNFKYISSSGNTLDLSRRKILGPTL